MPELIGADSVKIEKAIVHFLDLGALEAILSNYPAVLDDETTDYLVSHIVKIFNSDDAKHCTFEREGYVSTHLADARHEFIAISQELAKRFFGCMQDAGSVPSGDLIVLIAEIANEDYLCALKLNYKTSFVHEFRAVADTNSINFVKHQGILPGKNAKIDEAFLINIDTRDICLIEKKYEIGGVKDFYISPAILGATDTLSVKKQLETVETAAENIYREHYGETLDMKPRIAEVMCREIASTPVFKMDRIFDGFRETFPEAGGDFTRAEEALPVEKETQLPVPDTLVKKISRQKIKSKFGIELRIPVRVYTDPRAMEYVREPDGSLTLKIKHIDEGNDKKADGGQ